MKKIIWMSFLFGFISSSLQAKVELPDGQFHLSKTEMTIKTAEIDFSVTRTWYGGQWHFNMDWQNLVPEYSAPPAGVSSQNRAKNKRFATERLISLSRGRYKYTNRGNGIFVYDERKQIITTDTGYRWQNRDGDWINYDNNGQVVDFGNRNIVQGILARDTNGRVIALNNAQGNPIVTYSYNADGQVTSVVDSNTGRQTSYRYSSDQLVEATDVLGRSRFYGYSGNHLTSHSDANNNQTTVEYYLNNRVKSVLDKQGIGWTYIYDYDKVKKEFYIRQTHTSGRTIETWYDKTARLLRKDENGETVQTIQYGPYNRKDTITNHRGLITIKEYDAYRNLIKTTYPDGTTTAQQVDPEFSNITQKTDESGIVTRYEYNALGYLSTMIEAVGTVQERRTEYQTNDFGQFTQIKRIGDSVTAESTNQYQYNTIGNLVKMIDPLGRTTDYAYNSYGNRISQTQYNESNQPITTTYSYDAAGQLLEKTDPLGQRTVYQYDNNGNLTRQSNYGSNGTLTGQQTFTYDHRNNLISQTDSLGNPTTYAYDQRDNLTAITDAKGHSQTFLYDLFNRKTDSIDAGGYKTSWVYGAGGTQQAGLVTQIDYPTYSESLQYDLRGQMTQKQIQSKLPESAASTAQTTTYSYDNRGNRTATQDAKGRTTTYSYDALNRLLVSTDNQGKTTQYAYDNRDNLLSVTDANGHIIRRYSYDANNQNITETKALGQQDSQSYNSLGLLERSTDALGQVSRYSYNNNGQLTQIQRFDNGSAPSPNKTITFGYNVQGLLESYNDGTTSATYSYNQNNQKVSETVNYGSFSKTHSYSYNATGKKSSFTNGENFTVNYSYNDNDQIYQVQLPNIGYITYAYSNGQVEQISFPGNANQYWRYDALERPEGILVQDISQSVLDSRDYQYDKANNIVQQLIREGTLGYQYNNLDRLSVVNYLPHTDLEADYNHNTTHPPENEQYSYDPVGNRLSSHNTDNNWSYNDNNELLQFTQQGQNHDFQYNANGQMTQKTVNGTATYYDYNSDGRLQAIKDSNQNLIAAYTYDPFGRRISKTIYQDNIAQSTVYYLYSDEGLIAEYNESGELIQSYGYAPNSAFTTNPLYSHRPDFADSGGYVYYINDHLGTPKKVITNTGRIVWFGEAEAFGDTALVKDEYPNPLRFPGQYFDGESGLHYNFWRYYDSTTGRYITSDPIRLAGGLNEFLYSSGDPISLYDETGKISKSSGSGKPPGIPTIEVPPPIIKPKPKPSCEVIFTICLTRCMSKKVCKIPVIGKALKAGCAVFCSGVWAACRWDASDL